MVRLGYLWASLKLIFRKSELTFRCVGNSGENLALTVLEGFGKTYVNRDQPAGDLK